MIEYRVTKYDPSHRNFHGTYTRTEWTSFSDIGRVSNGSTLSEAEYLQVEKCYVVSALEFLYESGVSSLAGRELENQRGEPLNFGEGSNLSLEQLTTVLPRVLREEFWCKFEGPDAFIHIGYDYYMYVGTPAHCPKAQRVANKISLFVELFQSPYGNPSTA